MATLIKDAESLMNQLAKPEEHLIIMQLRGTFCIPTRIIKIYANKQVILKAKNYPNKPKFFLVILAKSPFKSIDDFVQMPCNCLIVSKDQMAVDGYPKDEDPFVTQDRVSGKERWTFYAVTSIYELAPKSSNKESLKIIRESPSRKALPRVAIKRPAPSEPEERLDGNQKNDAAQSSSTVVNGVSSLLSNQEQQQMLKKKIRLIKTQTYMDDTQQNPTDLMDQINQTNAPKSIRQALSTTHNKNIINEQQPQENKRALVNENHLNVKYNLRKSERIEQETMSPYHGLHSLSHVRTDKGVISDFVKPAVDSSIETTNNFCRNEISSGGLYVDRPTEAQNCTFSNDQVHTYYGLQKILDDFAILFTQMESFLDCTRNLEYNLRSSIQDLATSYRQILVRVKDFNATEYSINNPAPASNLTLEVSQSPLDRQIQVPLRAKRNDNQTNNVVAEKALNKNDYNSWRLIFPPEYDANDTRWTLNFKVQNQIKRNNHDLKKDGLVELMPKTGIYVKAAKLKNCLKKSRDYRSLAQKLLYLVFKRSALSLCSSMTENTQVFRPKLDEHAITVLLNFVIEHGLKHGWKINQTLKTPQNSILVYLHSEIQKCRYKYGLIEYC